MDPTLSATLVPRISKSAIECFARCPRLYYYQYILRMEQVVTPDMLSRGTLWHSHVLEPFWESAPIEEIPNVFHDPDMATIMNALSSGYVAKYGGEALDNLKILGVETEALYQWDSSLGIAYLDALVEYDGDTYLVESKTTESPIEDDAWYWNKLDLDLQTGYYVWLAQEALGLKIKGVIYDVTRVPKLTQGKDGRKKIVENTEQFKARVARYVADNLDTLFNRKVHTPDVPEVMEQVLMWRDMIEDAHNLNRFPKNHNGCFAFKETCRFKPVCKKEVDVLSCNLYRRKESRDGST